MPESIALEVVLTATWAEQVRAALDGRPMYVASWYRCAAYNRTIGGAPDSQHLTGRAIDFSQKGRAPTEVQQLILDRRLWPHPVRGLERDPGHTHVDRRPGAPAIF